MPETWQVRIFDHRGKEPAFVTEGSGSIQFGRQREHEKNPDPKDAAPYFSTPRDGGQRIVWAPLNETDLPREHVVAEPLPGGWVLLKNVHPSVSVGVAGIEGSCELRPQDKQEFFLPVTLHVGDRRIAISSGESYSLRTLAEPPAPPGAAAVNTALFTRVASAFPKKSLSVLLKAVVDLLHSAAIKRDFCDLAARALVDTMGMDTGRVLLREDGIWKQRSIATAAYLGTPDGSTPSASRHVLNNILQEKKTTWKVSPTDMGESLKQVSEFVAAPILDKDGEIVGALYGDRGQHGSSPPLAGTSIAESEATLVEIFATGVATGLARMAHEENERRFLRIESDLKFGRDIQFGFLPTGRPSIAGWEIEYYFQPAREVSGDFYDFFRLSDEFLVLAIADVSEKGIGPALYASGLCSLLRAFARQALGRSVFGLSVDAGPECPSQRRATLIANIVEFTNNSVWETHSKQNMFASLVFGVLNTTTGEFIYVNAGHPPPFVLGPSGVKARLGRTGPNVGVNEKPAYTTGCIHLEEGDALFAYTDGVTEARDCSDRFFSCRETNEHLQSLLQEWKGGSSVLDGVVAKLKEHVAGAEPYDDVTMLAVRRLPPAAK